MSKLNIGDRIKVVKDKYIWLDQNGLDDDTVLTIVEDDDDEFGYVNFEDLTIEIAATRLYPDDFEKVEDKFFAGLGSIVGTVIGEATTIPNTQRVTTSEGTITSQGTAITTINNSQLGVYRPVLTDRKVGKIGMHMVDDGFPNALREVAKVMTWAADAKGYKLHDWKNLPEADVALPSAGYRHRNDNSVQKALGLSAMERVDHESALLHKAHEAFNVLAELELILTGVIK